MLRGRMSVLQHWQLVSSGWMVRGSLVMALIALHPPSSAGVVWGHLPLPVSDPCTARHWWAKDSLWWAWAVLHIPVLQDSLLQPWGQLSPAAWPCSPLQGSKSSCKHLSDSWDLSENNAKKSDQNKAETPTTLKVSATPWAAPIQPYTSVGSPPRERMLDLLPIAIPLSALLLSQSFYEATSLQTSFWDPERTPQHLSAPPCRTGPSWTGDELVPAALRAFSTNTILFCRTDARVSTATPSHCVYI